MGPDYRACSLLLYQDILHPEKLIMEDLLIRLITIDLDGTLLDSKSRISGENREAIGYCMDNSIKVVLSTGKSMRCAAKVIQDLELTDLQIVSGGTMVVDKRLKPIAITKIPARATRDAVELARKYDAGFMLDTTDGMLHYDREYPEFEFFFRSGEVMKKVDDIMDDRIIDNALLFTFTTGKDHPFSRMLEKSITPDVKIRRGGPKLLNLLNADSGKVAGLKQILEIYKIDAPEVMAIGDNNNDKGTLEFAGISVAMGNAPDELKHIADHVTDDNDNSGVAAAIYKFIRK